jgi:nicotinate-nucleotide adenylyltransferase
LTLRLGILGGTFDPVHNAHLAMARAALERLALDKVLFIPTGAPRYRKAPLASGEHRVAMLELALREEPRFEIDERELAPGASAYTADTLKALKRAHPGHELVLLIGADQFEKLDTWHRPDQVRKLARIGVFARPGHKVKGAKAELIPLEAMAVSASELRARAARGEPLIGQVPAPVANYIRRHKLYA